MAELRICLDPGHGKGVNPGIVKGYYEGTAMFNLATYLKAELEKYENVTVLCTRKTVDDYPTLEERAQMAIDNNCSVFLSLHSNAFSSSAACGVSAYYSQYRKASKNLLDKLGNAVTATMRAGDGVTYFRGSAIRRYPNHPEWDYYAVIRDSVGLSGENTVVQYSYIIEHGFHTNLKECTFLSKADNLKKIAQAEAKVIAEYFGLKEPAPAPAPTPSTNFVVGNTVKFKSTAKTWANGKSIAAWIRKEKLYIRSNTVNNKVVVSIYPTGATSGTAFATDLEYYDAVPVDDVVVTDFKIGDKCKFKATATTWYGGQKAIPGWVKSSNLYIRSTYLQNGKAIKVSVYKDEDQPITGTANVSDLKRV